MIYSKIKIDSKGYSTNWKASFLGEFMPECKIEINTKRCDSKFNILGINDKGEPIELLNLKTPFDQERNIDNYDKRVFLLSKMIFDSRFERNTKLYKNTNKLWLKCEEKLTSEKLI